ncbi:uncharacterized protein ASPGLDRAFT_25863 [Aspergillus glaucus CBS 516.65]|uniref:Uncharacterized protein n=1 Tax=Aspergillus glaucus CBS 516.65 TaxID=1160497 RepID=A0A1L9VKJ5_ASPGL|nr:hypothetical protein ASPGLDRAFT_25863 [Aspergillus glaucus CBS 516.65]OJJ84421.1 hypothetical protein ASPGLDRAFT_25863 [Aspergillus glaucus CBS 516.65]
MSTFGGTPERRQREKEERRWNRRNGVGSSRLFVDSSNSSSSSSSDEFCSLPSHSESGNDDGEEEESESSESESGSERWQRSGRTYPVDDSDSDDSKLGKCTFMGNLKRQRRMAARYSKPPPNDQLLYTNEPRTPLADLSVCFATFTIYFSTLRQSLRPKSKGTVGDSPDSPDSPYPNLFEGSCAGRLSGDRQQKRRPHT